MNAEFRYFVMIRHNHIFKLRTTLYEVLLGNHPTDVRTVYSLI